VVLLDNFPARCKLLGNMTNTWLLAAVLALLVAQGVLIAAGILWIRRKVTRIESGIRSFITAPNDKTPSQLAVAIDQISQIVGRAVIVQAKATFMGEASAAARSAARADADAQMAKTPWLAAIAGLVPGFSKSLLKNPALAGALGQLFQKTGAGHYPGPTQGNGHASPQEQASMDFKIGG